MDRLMIAGIVVAAVGVLVALWRSRPVPVIARVNAVDFGLEGSGMAVAGFTSPMCHACQLWTERLAEHGIETSFVDVKERPDLAHRYGVRSTPVVLLVDVADGGSVVRHFFADPRPEEVAEVREAVLTPA